jgi:NAD(P)-dependent dehydrogenase (short-subunit alcohol dehydrogenase family)
MTGVDLAEKGVIVTGAGSGLGRAMALGLAQAGASVAALDVAPAEAEKTMRAAKDAPGRVLPVACDVRDWEQVQAAVARVDAELGGFHALVNCAGLGMAYLAKDYGRNPIRFWECDLVKWQDILDVNVRGTYLMARAVTPQLIARGWGRIVNVTTSFNTMMRRANMPYGQSKAALEAASAAWAGDLEGTGVTCNVLIPGGAADTPMVPPETGYDRSKLNDPRVMVAPIRWLCSAESDGVTGMRFIGRDWDPALPGREAMKAAGAPCAWPDLAAGAATSQARPEPKA